MISGAPSHFLTTVFEIYYGIMVQSLFRHFLACGTHLWHKYLYFLFSDLTYAIPSPITWSFSWPIFSNTCFYRNVIHTSVSVNFYSWTAATLLQALRLNFYSLENILILLKEYYKTKYLEDIFCVYTMTTMSVIKLGGEKDFFQEMEDRSILSTC